METHLLLEKGRNPSAIVAVLLGCALLLLFIVWAVHAQPGQGNPTGQAESTNDCYTAFTSNICTEASVMLTNATVSPTNGCVGLEFSASVNQLVTNGTNIVFTVCTNSIGSVCTNCPGPQTNSVTPGISNWWVVGGVSASPQSGTGISATFTPSTLGDGSITFYALWQYICDTGSGNPSAQAPFVVRCPIQTISASAPGCGISYGATFTYCYDCANKWFIKESVEQGIPNSCDPVPIKATTNAFQMAGNCVTDHIYDNNGPPANVADCADTTLQTIYTGPTADNLCCTYNNTQTITVARTNGTSLPPQGTVVTSSGGVSTNCSW